MRARLSRIVLSTVVCAGALSAAACEQLIGSDQDISSNVVPLDATVDGRRDGGSMGMKEGGNEAGKHDGASDGPEHVDSFVAACAEAGATQCAPNGLGVEMCQHGGSWSSPSACTGDTPLCIRGACACAPGSVRCGGSTYQTYQQCPLLVDGGGPPQWPPSTDAGCPGTCTLGGCAAVPPSCDVDAAGAGGLDGVGVCPGVAGGSNGPFESCCTSHEVTGGAFYVDHDVSEGAPSPAQRASVSGFRLDRFEVTVGRFRRFLAALVGGDASPPWRPAVGSGKHTYLNGGLGLSYQGDAGTPQYEPGWSSVWSSDLSALAMNPDSALFCDALSVVPNQYTWSPTVKSDVDESLPINCVTWIEAYAFCIWDGGFLPSDAEWNYAAAGGSAQSCFPWSRDNTDAGCDQADFTLPSGACTSTASGVSTDPAQGGPWVVGSVGGGSGTWHQTDLSGNVHEWTLDVEMSTGGPSNCTDCAVVPPTDGGSPGRVERGGSFLSDIDDIRVTASGGEPQTYRSVAGGFRCARPP